VSVERQTQQFLDDDGAVIGTAQYLGEKLDGVSRVFCAGVLIQEATYVTGQLHGQYLSWWNDGTPKEQGFYDRGNRVGVYRWFGSDGSLVQEHDYGSAP
jgi:antitoxin component YwqK of YwqJK toxin-antitoxin module